ncbi:MAG: hypothetical protein WBX01_04200 [Nitrososphaeraceae archaeon]
MVEGFDVHYDRTTGEDRLIEYTKAIPLLTELDPHTKAKVKEIESERLNNMDQYKEWPEKLNKDYELVPSPQYKALVDGYRGAKGP